ncbi:transcription factor [Acidobacteria bacterium AB60]|nr:transcription factor [Acidobacteria bacterium AB60]
MKSNGVRTMHCLRLLAPCLGITMILILASCGGSGSSGTTAGNRNPPTPAITSISPTSVLAGSGALTLTVNGTGFVSTSIVDLNGVAETTTYVSGAKLTAAIPAAQIVSGGQLAVVVRNGSVSSETGAPVNVMVENPIPAISSISPDTALTASSASVITVTGTGFVPATLINVNGSARPTTYVSATQLIATLTAADFSAAGSLSLAAVNPAPGGGTSAAVVLTVNNPAVGPITLSPSILSVGATSPATITVTGNSFLPNSVVMVNGSTRSDVYVNPSALTFTATVADQAAATTLSVTVTNPQPGGGTSPPAVLTIGSATPAPVISTVTPSQILEGSPDTQISVAGRGFSNNSVVYWNGVPLTLVGITGSSDGTTLTATVPAADLTATGTASVTVSTPGASPSLSNAATVTIDVYPYPTVTGISPTAIPLNTPTTITVSGSGFTSLSVISIDGTTQPTGFTNSTTLTAQVPASILRMPGVFALVVTTPGPGGGTSTTQYLTAYVPIVNNSMAYNPVNGLFYLSVPSSAGVPYGNSIVSVDPLTGNLGTPIPIGAEPDQLAITADGRYLWVALDGASAVRRLDLQTGIPGAQFTTVQGSLGFAASALVPVPNQPNSVVVATPAVFAGQALAIYDSGAIRGAPAQATFFASGPWGLAVDSNKQELYAAGSQQGGGQGYATYTYDASGLSQKFLVGYNSNQYASQNNNEITVVNGSLYTDFGQVYNAEDATLLGSFYSSGSVLAQGSTAVDSTLGLAFVLEGGWYSDGFQLQAFRLSDFALAPAAPIQSANPTARAPYMIEGPTGNRLTRWGSDGLAYRTTGGFMSLRASMVRDLSTTNADLGVALSTSGSNSTGSATTYTVKITNQGPNAASSVALVTTVPSTGVLTSVASTSGTCAGTTTVVCNLATLSNGASTTVTFTVQQTNPGTAVMTTQASASENDPHGNDNVATSNLTITGAAFNLKPVITGMSPQAILSGSSDTEITLTGSNFAAGAVVLLNGNPLATTAIGSTELQATVPASYLKTLGWATISISNPRPGGGISAALPLSIFSTVKLGANHIVFDPYSRKIMASVSTGSSTLAANSIVAIDPATGSVGPPVAAGGKPTVLALSTNGNSLYALVPGATSGAVMRFNMLTQQADFSVQGFQPDGYNAGLRDLAVQPGSENTVAVDEGEYPGISIFDFDPVAKTGTRRGSTTGSYTGTCLAFPNAQNLLALDLYTSPSEVEEYAVTTSGLLNGSYPYAIGSIVQNQNCYKLSGDVLVSEGGGVSSTGTIPLTQLGVFEGLTSRSNYATGVKDFEADSALGMAYFLTNSPASQYNQPFDTISGYDLTTFMPSTSLVMPFATIENGIGYSVQDVVRWGQDGLALLTNDTLYFVRGPLVLPELLNTNAAPVLSVALKPIAHGTGNTLLTLTGSNFVPGAAVTWNGSYRTTTVVDSGHITVAIPASDIALSGSVSVIAVNPGSSPSNTITVTIN